MSAAQQLPEQPSETGTEIALLDRPLTGALVFAPGAADRLIDQLVAKVRATPVDVSTPKGRAACKRLGRDIASSRIALDNMGKELNASLREQVNRTDAERRVIKERLGELQAEVLAPVAEFEAREERRVQGHQAELNVIPAVEGWLEGASIADMEGRLAYLRAYPARDWEEFSRRATDAIAREITLTTVALEEAQKREAEAARIAAEQAQAAEEARQEAERLRVERETRIAAEAAEAARVAAEREAERARLLALEEAEAREMAAQEAERTRLAEIEAEHRRQTEAAARAERDRAAAVEAEHARQVEAADQVRRVAERERLAADQRAQRAEQERLAAEERAAEAARQAEVDRVAAAERAELDRQAAVRAEREEVARVHAAEQAAAAEREADKAHQAKRNNEVVAALVEHAGLSAPAAKATVTALAKRLIPHTTISY